MIKEIQDNPFRILGVYSNSATKDIVANEGKMKAFLKVGRAVSYPLDLPSILPDVERSEEIVASAKSQIALPDDKFKHAQFWFVRGSDEDDAAFKFLFSGAMDKAIEHWSQQKCAAAYQNRMICYLIKDDLDNALQMACILYEPMDAGYFTLVNIFLMELLKLVLGKDNSVDASGVDEHLFDVLVKHYGSDVIMNKMPDGLLKDQLVESIAKNLIADIHKHINSFSENKKKSATESLNAGRQLITSTKPLLVELKKLISPTDTQYQMIADKLSLSILQCGIDYFNNSDDSEEAAPNAMSLQKYALSIAVGSLAKERCQENVNILQKILANLPPKEVKVEAKAIENELEKFCKLPDKISHSLTLLNTTKPHVQAIKNKLGASNSFYLHISTQVVGNALHNVIEEVNAAMERVERSARTKYVSSGTPDLLTLLSLKDTLQSAWDATKIMDTFDLEAAFKTRYNTNRASLKNLCEQVGISTSTYSAPARSTSTRSTSTTTARPAAAYSSSSSSRTSGSQTSSSTKDNSGAWIAFWAVTIICAFWGAFGDGHGFDFVGFLAGGALGALIPGNIVRAIFSK